MKKILITGSVQRFLLAGIFSFISFSILAVNAPITTAATITTAIPGQQVTVPVTVTGFTNIGSLYLCLDYEYAKLHYVSGVYNPSLGGVCNIGDMNMGNGFHRLIISWYGSQGMTLTDGSWIVNYVFTYISGPASLQWFDNGASCSYSDPAANTLNDIPSSTYYINGLVSNSTPVNTRVFLEGPFAGKVMNTTLKDLGLLPLLQPYTASPWNYSGTEQVVSIPANVTDWILVELRTGPSASTKVATRAGFLTSDGYITDLAGTGKLNFAGLSAGNYYIVIHHRNHMPLMSAAAVALSATGALYDFSLGSAQVYGGANACKNIFAALSIWGMISADASNEGNIFIDDYTDYWVPAFGITNGYSKADFNMDGNVFINDYTDYWVPNFGKSNVLP
ncbi:MAG: hypothetical protein WCI92_15780 [Bacteroidota bacterium]